MELVYGALSVVVLNKCTRFIGNWNRYKQILFSCITTRHFDISHFMLRLFCPVTIITSTDLHFNVN